MRSFGNSFKKIREMRKMSQEEVSKGISSTSQVSNFENGKGDITLSKFFSMIKRMGITFEEYEHTLNNYELDEFHKMMSKIRNFYNENNDHALKELLLAEDKKEEKENIYHELNCLMIKNLISELDGTHQLSRKEITTLSEYFMSTEEWTYHDLILYNNTMRAFPTKTVETLTNEAIARSVFYSEIPRNKGLIIEMLINASIIFYDCNKLDRAIYFIKCIERLLEEASIYEKTLYLFVTGAMEFSSGKEEVGKKKMEDAIGVFNTVGSYHLAKSYQENYEEIVGKCKK